MAMNGNTSSQNGLLSKNRYRLPAYPYVLWMALFVVIPIILIVVYAFTNASGSFTFDNFAHMNEYASVFGRAFGWLS
jgi:spermidine/putrescine transport system permease protein